MTDARERFNAVRRPSFIIRWDMSRERMLAEGYFALADGIGTSMAEELRWWQRVGRILRG